MADWRDVMNVRSDADEARSDATRYGEYVESGEESSVAMAVLLGSLAVAAEIRALAVLIDYARADAS